MIACWLVKLPILCFILLSDLATDRFRWRSTLTRQLKSEGERLISTAEEKRTSRKKRSCASVRLRLPFAHSACSMIGSAVVIKQTTRNLFHGHHRPTEVDGDWSKKNFSSLSINRCKFIRVSRAPDSLPVLNGSFPCYFFFGLIGSCTYNYVALHSIELVSL